MTPLTVRWIRGVAVAVNALVLLRMLLSLVTLFRVEVAGGQVNLSSGLMVWLALTVVAPILSIVAILVVKTADPPTADAIPS